MEQELLQNEKLFEFHPKTSLTAMSGGLVPNISFTEIKVKHLRQWVTEG